MDIFGIRLVGINAENGQKLFITLLLVGTVFGLRQGIAWFIRRTIDRRAGENVRFWTRQGVNLGLTLLLVLALLSVWFDDPTRLATALGLVTAGLAFALQRVVTAVAGYFVILRGANFTVGDRITMGGVRGDVIGLGFIQTTIMEMGQPPPVQNADPAVWVRSRQYTGRVVTVTNGKIFEEPVYNYSREFPYLWEEMTLPIAYSADRDRVEAVLLAAANRHAGATTEASRASLAAMQGRYFIQGTSVEPQVYYRLTDNWVELTLRFVTEVRGVRDVKDAMSREILRELDAAGIGLASATYEIVSMPELRIRNETASR